MVKPKNCFGLGPIIKSVLIEAKPIKEGPKSKQGQEAQIRLGFLFCFLFLVIYFVKSKGPGQFQFYLILFYAFIICHEHYNMSYSIGSAIQYMPHSFIIHI